MRNEIELLEREIRSAEYPPRHRIEIRGNPVTDPRHTIVEKPFDRGVERFQDIVLRAAGAVDLVSREHLPFAVDDP